MNAISVRFPKEILEKAEKHVKLIEQVRRRATHKVHGRVGPIAVLRTAFVRGLEELEAGKVLPVAAFANSALDMSYPSPIPFRMTPDLMQRLIVQEANAKRTMKNIMGLRSAIVRGAVYLGLEAIQRNDGNWIACYFASRDTNVAAMKKPGRIVV